MPRNLTLLIITVLTIVLVRSLTGQAVTGNENKNIPFEDIWLHTDRDEYIAGEFCWFAAYLFDRNNRNTPGVSTIAYIELLNCRNIPVVQKRIPLSKGLGSGCFQLPDTLSPGTYFLRAYTNVMKSTDAGHCFTRPVEIFNIFSRNEFRRVITQEHKLGSQTGSDNSVSLMAPAITGRREKITLEIELDRNIFRSPEEANLSVSVAAELGKERYSTIDEYLRLSSRNPGIANNQQKPEITGHLLSGRLIRQKPGAVIGNQIMFLTVPGKEAFFRYAVTDSAGRFSFMIDNEDIPQEIVISLKDNRNGNLINILSPFLEAYREFDIITDTIIAVVPCYIEEWSTNHQVSKIYGISPAGELLTRKGTPVKRARFYGIPDMELRMSDYILLPAMQEVFFELIPGVSMRTGRARYGITVSNPFDNRTYEEDATLMVNGVIIDDPAIITEMNPEIVERIDIVRNEHLVGGFHFYGIVNIITKPGDYSAYPLPANAVRFPYTISHDYIPFTSADYSVREARESREPDFRNTLYWNPAVSPGADGKVTLEFWSSDYRSDYVIDIQGLTTGGIPISCRKIITVR